MPVIPKQSLTGNNSERVDQRVLQVIYELPEDRQMDVYIGQQMDVYMKAATISRSIDSEVGLGNNGTLPFEDEARTSYSGKPDA
jgi:HlyD family secretion protein